jgi:hypothetical protein
VNSASRVYRSLLVVIAAAVAVALVPAVTHRHTATASAAATVAGPKGFGSQQPGIAYEDPGSMNRDLAAIAAAGMTWVRADFYWSSIQAFGRSSFEWGSTDAFAKAAKAHGLNVLALVAYTPAWARTGKVATDPPDNPADYANFVHAAALRYAPLGVHAWEIWNEPNMAMFWSPKADAAGYTALLKRAYPAIKSADPKAIVVTGGLAPSLDTSKDVSPMSFLAEVYLHGGKGSFDAAGLHPYSFPYAPMYKADWNTFYETPDLHSLMASVGDGKKAVWGTETGYPTGTSSGAVSEKKQADDLVAAIGAWRRWSFVGPLFLYTLRDISDDKGNFNDNMGILRETGQPKPSYAAIHRVLH